MRSFRPDLSIITCLVVAATGLLGSASAAAPTGASYLDRNPVDPVLRAAFGRDSAQFAPTAPIPLLVETDAPAPSPPALDAEIALRRRAVSIDFGALNHLDPDRGDQVIFNLFDDAVFVARFDRLVERTPTSYTWFGALEGDLGTFALLSHKGVVFVNVDAGERGQFAVRSVAGRQYVIEYDPALVPGCGAAGLRDRPRPVKLDDGDVAVINRGAAEDDGSVIDVLTVWTEEAEIDAGSSVEMEAASLMAVDWTNLAYLNSGINTQIRLVHLQKIEGYSEVDPQSYYDELDDLTLGVGLLNEAHALRDQYGADLVAMLISHYADGVAGLAWLLADGPDADDYGFSISNWFSASLGRTYAHELGHNQGCAHERENSSGPGYFSYSYGYETDRDDLGSDAFHTIMAYNCADQQSCRVIQHFSNPEVFFEGYVTGVAEGEPGEADNARTINETAYTVANFRVSVVSPNNPGQVTRLTNGLDGMPSDGDSRFANVSHDGRYIAFSSKASNLTATPRTAENEQIYLIDRDVSGNGLFDEVGDMMVRMLTESISEIPATGDSSEPSISADGCRVVFPSYAADLIETDENFRQDVFLAVRESSCRPTFMSDDVVRASAAFDDPDTDELDEPNGASSSARVSRDGRFVVYESAARNLQDPDESEYVQDLSIAPDIYLRDLQRDEMHRVSVGLKLARPTPEEVDPDGPCIDPAVSNWTNAYRGRVSVAFSSRASNLIDPAGEDLGGIQHIYVRDIYLAQPSRTTTRRVSIFDDGSELGIPANGYCARPDISADGRYVTFETVADNLDPLDTNATWDIYVHDRDVSNSGVFDVPGNTRTYLVSSRPDGQPGVFESRTPRISPDGHTIVFSSYASNLVLGDGNASYDVYRKLWRVSDSGGVLLVSVSPDGFLGDSHSTNPDLSQSGDVIVFQSAASNLAPDDTNEALDIFVFEVDRLFGDLDGDCIVSTNDLTVLLDAWGSAVPAGEGADLSGDGVIGFDDLSLLLDAFGDVC